MEHQDNDIMQLKDTMKQGMVKVNTPLGHFLHSPNPLWATYLIQKKYLLEPTPYFEVARLEFA